MLWQGAEYGCDKKNLKSISTPPLPSKKEKWKIIIKTKKKNKRNLENGGKS